MGTRTLRIFPSDSNMQPATRTLISGGQWVVWERQIWSGLLWPCVKVPNCGARRERLAAIEIISNIQLLWNGGQMKKLGLQQMLQPQGSVAASLGKMEGIVERVQGLQWGKPSVLFAKENLPSQRVCGKNDFPHVLHVLSMGLLLMAQGICRGL